MGRADVTLTPEVRARLDRVRLRLIFLRWGVPLVPLGATSLVAIQRGFWVMMILPGVLSLICGVYYGRRRYQPWAWPDSARLVGAVAGFQTFSALGYVFLLPGVPVSSVAGLMVIVFAGGLFVGVFGCGWVGKSARDRVLTPFGPDLIDSPIEIGFVSTRDRHITLLVGADKVRIAGSYWFSARSFADKASLYLVGPVQQITVSERFQQRVSRGYKESMTVYPGPAVRIPIQGREDWVLNTDRGADIVELIDARR